MDVKRLAQQGDWEYIFGYLRDYGYVVAWIGAEPAFDAEHTRIVCPVSVMDDRSAMAEVDLAGDHTGAVVFGNDQQLAENYWESMLDSLDIEDKAPSREAIV